MIFAIVGGTNPSTFVKEFSDTDGITKNFGLSNE